MHVCGREYGEEAVTDIFFPHLPRPACGGCGDKNFGIASPKLPPIHAQTHTHTPLIHTHHTPLTHIPLTHTHMHTPYTRARTHAHTQAQRHALHEIECTKYQ